MVVGKDALELVVARFDEDLSWSAPYRNVRTVYNKGAPPAAGSGAARGGCGGSGHAGGARRGGWGRDRPQDNCDAIAAAIVAVADWSPQQSQAITGTTAH